MVEGLGVCGSSEGSVTCGAARRSVLGSVAQHLSRYLCFAPY